MIGNGLVIKIPKKYCHKTHTNYHIKQAIRTHFPDILDGLDKFLGKGYHINIEKDVPLHRTAPRPLPMH